MQIPDAIVDALVRHQTGKAKAGERRHYSVFAVALVIGRHEPDEGPLGLRRIAELTSLTFDGALGAIREGVAAEAFEAVEVGKKGRRHTKYRLARLLCPPEQTSDNDAPPSRASECSTESNAPLSRALSDSNALVSGANECSGEWSKCQMLCPPEHSPETNALPTRASDDGTTGATRAGEIGTQEFKSLRKPSLSHSSGSSAGARMREEERVSDSDAPLPFEPELEPLAEHSTAQILRITPAEAAFLEFWAIYLQHDGGEDAAREAWFRHIRPSDYGAVSEAAENIQAERRELRFVPHAQRFLAGQWKEWTSAARSAKARASPKSSESPQLRGAASLREALRAKKAEQKLLEQRSEDSDDNVIEASFG